MGEIRLQCFPFSQKSLYGKGKNDWEVFWFFSVNTSPSYACKSCTGILGKVIRNEKKMLLQGVITHYCGFLWEKKQRHGGPRISEEPEVSFSYSSKSKTEEYISKSVNGCQKILMNKGVTV